MSINQPININSINNNKKIVKIKANDEDLIFLTKETSVLKFVSLDGMLEIKRNFSRFIVEGELEAHLIQEDAITSEEIKSVLKLKVKRVLEKELRKDNSKKLKDLVVMLDKEDDVDVLENDTIDIQAICLEELLLNINPFIKK